MSDSELDERRTRQRTHDLFERIDAVRDGSAMDALMVEIQSGALGMLAAPIDYVLGYACYLHPNRRHWVELQERTHRYFLAVVSAAPDHYRGWLYLGHNKYDLGAWAEARSYFERARALASYDYYGLKSYEMMVCSVIQENGVSAAIPELETFARAAEASDPDDVVPQQLARVVTVLSEASLQGRHADTFRALLRRIDIAGDHDFWLDGLSRRPFMVLRTRVPESD